MLHRHAGPAVAGSYTLGAIMGAACSATALVIINGLLSPVPASLRATLAICGLVLVALRALGVVCIDLPQRRRQIARETFRSAPPAAAFRFAFELGTGVRTYVTASAPYALVLVLALCLPAGVGALTAAVGAAVGYGLGRSVVVGVQAVRGSIAVEHPHRWLKLADIAGIAASLAVATTFAASV